MVIGVDLVCHMLSTFGLQLVRLTVNMLAAETISKQLQHLSSSIVYDINSILKGYV